MVYLKKIETKGFKSLGSSQQSVPVEKGFVAITGPNGSGKSNLLDAILFALGENSAKTLRAANLSALIYDASVEEQKPSFARVSLQFDNVDRGIPVDYDTATITRELKSTGESLYWLNGKHMQRNNLSELLEMALINSRGLNIVLQGMITRISELIPDEKRKLIEQLVGVAQFDEKKQQAMKQLNDADVKLEVAMAKIGVIRERVQLLEEQRNDQLRLRQLEDLTKWLKAVSISSKLLSIRDIKESRKKVIGESASRLEQLQIQLANFKTEEESLDSERRELVRSTVDSGTIELETRIGKIENDISALNKERMDATNLINTNNQVLPVLDKMIGDQHSKIDQSEILLGSLNEKLTEKEVEKKQYLDLRLVMNKERSEIDNEISLVQARITALRKQKETYDTKFSKIREHFIEQSSAQNSMEEKLSSDREKIRFYEENLASAEKSIADLRAILSDQMGQLGLMEDQKEKLLTLGRRVEEHLDIALLILEKAETAVVKHDSDLSAIENVASEEIALSRLENFDKEKVLDGYYGPLRKLISFDPKYSAAIAALGRSWLNAIIVKDLQSLTKLAEVARTLNISRLSVIPLSEVREIEKINAGGEGTVLSTAVIECDPTLRGVINFVFGDSVIVETPKSAFLAARKGLRAATLVGDLFEAEVLAFETGYSKSYSKIVDVLDQQKSFEGIRSALDSLRKIIGQRRTSLSRLHSKSIDFEKAASRENIEITRTEERLENSRQILNRYQVFSKTLSTKLGESERDIIKIRDQNQSGEKSLKAYGLGSAKLSSLLSNIDLESFGARNADFNKRKTDVESRIDSVVSEIRDLTTEIIRVRSDTENAQRPNLERLKQQRAQSQEVMESRKVFLLESNPKLEILEKDFGKLREEESLALEKANRFKPLLDGIEDRLKRLRSEIDLTQHSLVSTQRELDTARIDLEKLGESETTLFEHLNFNGYSDLVESFPEADPLLAELQVELNSLLNNVNNLADDNYREIFENYKYSSVRKNELEKERNAIVTFIETIDAEKQKVFVEAFDRINKELGMIFSKMTAGSAWLELEMPESLFDGGIFLMTQFPGQLPRDSSSVSGGQKTVAALSFILAIQAVFPSPFYVFDEVDAPLDSHYSGKMAEILAERSKYSQIIIVSLKDTVVAKAATVIGVYMSRGSSKIIQYRSPLEAKIQNE